MATQRSLDEAYMRCAKAIAELSHAERKKVGAILVSLQGIIAEGYNGTYSGADNTCEVVCISHEWHDTSFENHLVCNTGQVLRVAHDKQVYSRNKSTQYSQTRHYDDIILKERISPRGYVEVKIDGNWIKVHQLVAQAFINNPDKILYCQVNHIDGNKINNHVLNLEWCTNRYNSHYERPEDFVTHKFLVSSQHLVTKPEVLHAESNAIAKVAKSTNSSLGATLYATCSPCYECSKMIIQAGIKRVVYEEEYRLTEGLILLRQANIEVVKLSS